MAIHRVSRLTCMGCGFPQRCRILSVGETEVMPECHACGRADSWMSDFRVDAAAVEQEFALGRAIEAARHISARFGLPPGIMGGD